MWPPDARHALGAHQPCRRARGACGAHPRRARADRFGADRRRPARNDRVKTLGAVLAGGLSSRFGSDKALAMLGGRTLLDHAQAALRPHCDALIVVGRGEGLADWPQPDMGPLGGVAGALRHAASEGFDQLLTAPVDCLRLPPDLDRKSTRLNSSHSCAYLMPS